MECWWSTMLFMNRLLTIKLVYFQVSAIPDSRIYIIEQEDRIYIIETENHIFTIENEIRILYIEC